MRKLFIYKIIAEVSLIIKKKKKKKKKKKIIMIFKSLIGLKK